MGRPMLLPSDFDLHDFIGLMKKEAHGRNRLRLLAMYHLQQGKGLSYTAEAVQQGYKTVQAWLRRFRERGFEGLYESQRSGAPKKMTPEVEASLFETIHQLSESKTGGYITGTEIHVMLKETYGIHCGLRTVYNTLHRLGLSWITSRSMHPKSNKVEQEAYKKSFRNFSESYCQKRLN